jgi:regulator of cell morphogenesis and NO signaling
MIQHSNLLSHSVGEIVAADFRTAEIFKNAGIDFCCGGNKSLEQACREKNINYSSLIGKIEVLKSRPVEQSFNFKDWNLSFLADYIVNNHHTYVLKAIPELVGYTRKIASVHGMNHPELIEVADLFGKVKEELLQHLKMEEEILFPAIKTAYAAPTDTLRNIIRNETARLNQEHEFAGEAIDKIRILTQNYTVPEDACHTYRLALIQLHRFEDDLHIHVHLENNVLFPRALAI